MIWKSAGEVAVLEVAIFAYNRKTYLENAFNSVRRNLPEARVTVYDDGSDAPDMLAYLEEISDHVFRVEKSPNDRHGGLYRNMQAALDRAEAPYLLMMQDDTQIVRRVGNADVAAIDTLFQTDEGRGFVTPLFMKGEHIDRFRKLLTPDATGLGYAMRLDLPEREERRRIVFYDVSIAHVGRLREARWNFADAEGRNIEQARKLFSNMPFLRDPFLFFCPEVPFFRNRSQYWAAELASRRHVPAFFEQMQGGREAELLGRSIEDWPVAEMWLKPTRPVKRPFVFKDVQAHLGLYALYKIEQLFRR